MQLSSNLYKAIETRRGATIMLKELTLVSQMSFEWNQKTEIIQKLIMTNKKQYLKNPNLDNWKEIFENTRILCYC